MSNDIWKMILVFLQGYLYRTRGGHGEPPLPIRGLCRRVREGPAFTRERISFFLGSLSLQFWVKNETGGRAYPHSGGNRTAWASGA
jgi:hypothetical protein